jgi:ParB-like chromosome segregation protein Spo0J
MVLKISDTATPLAVVLPVAMVERKTMQIEHLTLEQLTPYENNPRVVEKAVAQVAESLKQFGFRQPIVVDAKRVIIAGHVRFLAAQHLGLKTVPVHVAIDLTDEQVAAYRLADNKLAELADWDEAKLATELLDVAGTDIDLTLLGFDADDFAKSLLANSQGEALPLPQGDMDEDLPPPQQTLLHSQAMFTN